MSQPARTTAPRSPRTTSAHTTAARTAARTTAARPSTARAGNRGATGPQLRLVPPGATTPARIRVFVDFLAARLSRSIAGPAT